MKAQPQAQAQPRPEELDPSEARAQPRTMPRTPWARRSGRAARARNPCTVSWLHQTKGDGFLGRGRMLDYLWRWSGEEEDMDRLPTCCVIHLPRGSGRAELARAPAASGHRTLPGARLFTVGYQWLCLAIKFMKRGGVPGRRAGPRSFPTLIGISQALRAAVKDLGCPEPRLPLPARPPARRLAGCCPAWRGSGGQGCGPGRAVGGEP